MEAGDAVADCQNECTEEEQCIYDAVAEAYQCRLQKEEIANGFFLSTEYRESENRIYISDLEIAFDIFEKRANILGVRILDTSTW